MSGREFPECTHIDVTGRIVMRGGWVWGELKLSQGLKVGASQKWDLQLRERQQEPTPPENAPSAKCYCKHLCGFIHLAFPKPMMKTLLLLPFYSSRDWGPERSHNFLRTTQLGSSRVGLSPDILVRSLVSSYAVVPNTPSATRWEERPRESSWMCLVNYSQVSFCSEEGCDA